MTKKTKQARPIKLPKLSRALNWLEKVTPPKVVLLQEELAPKPGRKKAGRKL